MSFNQQQTEELNELSRQIQFHNPNDLIQFCANYFNKRLEDQRKDILQKKDQIENSTGLKLFTTSTGATSSLPSHFNQLHSRQERGSVAFKTPFTDNDPHSSTHIFSPTDGSSSPSNSQQEPNSQQQNTSMNTGLFKGTYGMGDPMSTDPNAPTTSGFASSFESNSDPNDPMSKSAPTNNKAASSNSISTGNFNGYSNVGGIANATFGKSPLNFNANRRTSVSAEALNPDKFSSDWKPPVHDFSQEQLKRLNASVVKNFLFSQLDEDSLRTIIFALEEKRVPKNSEIIRQGDEGDFFYIIENGTVDFYVNGNKVNTSGPGSSFGELALMYNSPRAATALAESDCILWALDRMTFRRILLEGTARKRSMYENFLKDVPLLKSLSLYERNKLADALNTEVYTVGQNVVTEGEAGENFYFIESGTADVIKEGDGTIKTLKKGDYFGELALLHDSPRLATVKATSPLKVVTLGKSGFQRLLGPAVNVLKLQDPTKLE
ncbi:hypothetical protein B5S33_g2690 [[Candida] boidinii]|nr:hypothetical protein B5S33_g2690 [[Candida] boidinii]